MTTDYEREDKRLAASLRVSISSYVGTASLAVLAGSVAVFTYYQQNFKPMVLFYVCIAGATLAIVLSLLFGGWGAARVAREVASSNYTGAKIQAFDNQAILALISVVLILAAVVCGSLSHTRPSTNKNVGTVSTAR